MWSSIITCVEIKCSNKSGGGLLRYDNVSVPGMLSHSINAILLGDAGSTHKEVNGCAG